jgi:hypothetical protein
MSWANSTPRKITSCTLVIDLKPKQNKTNVSFYEVTDVCGVSDSGWTPILLRLRALFDGRTAGFANVSIIGEGDRPAITLPSTCPNIVQSL